MSRGLRVAYLVFAALFLAAVSAQVIMAGLALFWRSSVWDSHVGIGHMAAAVPLIMLVLALVGRLPLRLRSLSVLLLIGVVLQAEFFPLIREISDLASAYHPFLAMLLFWGGTVATHRAWILARSPVPVESWQIEPAVSGGAPQRAAPRCDPLTGAGCA